MLDLQHGCHERLFAVEMVVERALGNPGGFGNRVDARLGVSLPVKQVIGGIDDVPLCLSRMSRHRATRYVYRLVSLHRGTEC